MTNTKMLAAALCLSLTSFSAFAAQKDSRDVASNSPKLYDTKSIKVSNSPLYGDQDIEYIVLKPGSGPQTQRINFAISKLAHEMRCDKNPEDAKNMEYEARFVVLDINKLYVSFTNNYTEDCGGAHPDGSIDSYVYIQKTGTRLDVNKELGLDPSLDSYDSQVTKLAAVLKKHAPKDLSKDCEINDTLQSSDYSVGLQGKKLVVNVNPPHVMAACGFAADVSLEEVQPLLKPNSILNVWLK